MSRSAGRSVRDVMSMEVVSVVPEMTMRELAETLLEARVRGAPVLDPCGKLLGEVSSEDVVRLAANGGVDGVRVRDAMHVPARVVRPDEPVAALLSAFVHGGLRRALVVENDILLGVVTPMDALRALSAQG
jgi:predicted transcriptional regulator